MLRGERGLTPPGGLRLFVHSDVPMGKGVSSSAALEVAAMHAICAAYSWALTGEELALLCQKGENLVAGAPCGVMDQMTAACGQANRLLALLCQPAALQPFVQLPPDVEVWGIDSGIRHAVSGSDYTSVRVGAFMGYRILTDLAGLPARVVGDGQVDVVDDRWHGYLANVTPSEWLADFAARVPETLDGATFLQRYGGFTDRVTCVDPGRTYAVRAPAAHPIFEHHRVQLYRALLMAQGQMASTERLQDHAKTSPPDPAARSAGPRTLWRGDRAAGDEVVPDSHLATPAWKPVAAERTQNGSSLDAERLALLGELMYQSHASYSACGLGSDGTDRLVALVRAAGPAAGLYGAKITGGGSGGTVAVLARRGSRAAVDDLRARYERKTGRATILLGGTSPGAMRFGIRRLLPA